MKNSSAMLMLFVAATLASAWSCERSASPSAPQPPPGVTVARVEVVAAPTLAPGASTQLRAVVYRSDGGSEDVTAAAQWHSNRADVIAVAPDGVATGLQTGESNLFATHMGRTSPPREVVVVPDNTYRVVGRVTEEDAMTFAVPAARVEAEGVPPVFTDAQGLYRLYGVAGDAMMRVSKDGYMTTTHTLAIHDHHTENFALPLAAPRPDVSGGFELTIEAAPVCRGKLPDDVLVRHYQAEISQAGPRVSARLSGGTFGLNGNSLNGSISGARLTLVFFYDPYYYGDASPVEVLPNRAFYVISGRTELSQVSTGFVGTLDGTVWVLPYYPYRGPAQSSCSSTAHRVTLSR